MKANSEHFNSYESVIDWLFVQLPNYQAQGTSAYKPGLGTITTLLESINHPQSKFKSIHLAGTNGKGSTAHMLSSVYQEAGYKVGIFTSPHILDFRERVKINGKMISKSQVIDFVNQAKDTIDKLNATFFEITTALAFQVFADQAVDLAIIETGLGGRLDSTNIIQPELSIITTIGLDHTQFLGDSIEEIAQEKAGIIKQNTPVLVGNIKDIALDKIAEIAKSRNSNLNHFEISDLASDLKGAYQKDNLSLAVSAIRLLQDEFPVNESQIQSGLLQVAKSTCFLGRFQQINEAPKIILDAAHNTDGVKQLLDQIKIENKGQLYCVYGCSADKDMNSVFELFPKNAQYFFCEFDSSRSAKMGAFEVLSKDFNLNATVFKSSSMAMKAAKTVANEIDTIIVFGSFFIMTELLD